MAREPTEHIYLTKSVTTLKSLQLSKLFCKLVLGSVLNSLVPLAFKQSALLKGKLRWPSKAWNIILQHKVVGCKLELELLWLYVHFLAFRLLVHLCSDNPWLDPLLKHIFRSPLKADIFTKK